MGDHPAGADVVKHHAHAHHALHVAVFSPPHKELLTHVVGALVHHEAATVHPAGLAVVDVGGHVGTVAHALIGATLEVTILVEDNLYGEKDRHFGMLSGFLNQPAVIYKGVTVVL